MKIHHSFSLMLWRFFLFTCLIVVSGCEFRAEEKETRPAEEIKVSQTMEADLTLPPLVPKPTAERAAKKLVVKMEVIEKEMEMTDGVSYVYWTFDGTVPGSFIRTKVGDEIEFHLRF